MTLSRFLRDYLYIPLGGNRRGTGRTYVNLMATMLLGGLWHGAAWTFVAWGALHGAGLAVGRLRVAHQTRRMALRPPVTVAADTVPRGLGGAAAPSPVGSLGDAAIPARAPPGAVDVRPPGWKSGRPAGLRFGPVSGGTGGSATRSRIAGRPGSTSPVPSARPSPGSSPSTWSAWGGCFSGPRRSATPPRCCHAWSHRGPRVSTPSWSLVVLAAVATQFIPSRWTDLAIAHFSRWSILAQAFAWAPSYIAIDVWGPVGVAPFIYFRF